jgi:shikimate kinase
MTLKLKRTPGIYLVGFMASGKSTVGRTLADQLGWPFVDIDAEIEQQEKQRISGIFMERGENIFRDLETQAIRRRVNLIEAGWPCVVALGGGAFVQTRNWELIQNNGITVWLDCSFEKVNERLCGDSTRPLATDPAKLAKLWKDRRPLYARADHRVEVDSDDVDAIVQKILRLPIF